MSDGTKFIHYDCDLLYDFRQLVIFELADCFYYISHAFFFLIGDTISLETFRYLVHIIELESLVCFFDECIRFTQLVLRYKRQAFILRFLRGFDKRRELFTELSATFKQSSELIVQRIGVVLFSGSFKSLCKLAYVRRSDNARGALESVYLDRCIRDIVRRHKAFYVVDMPADHSRVSFQSFNV